MNGLQIDAKSGGHLLLSESMYNRKSRFSTMRQEGVRLRNSIQDYFSALPVHTDLGRNGATKTILHKIPLQSHLSDKKENKT